MPGWFGLGSGGDEKVPKTEEELEEFLVEKYDSQLREIYPQDNKASDTLRLNYIKRFCVARSYTEEKIVPMLDAHWEWRQEYGLPIKRHQVREELDKGKYYLHGTDLEGRPVIIALSRKQDPWARDLDLGVRAIIYTLELAIAMCEQNPDGPQDIIVLADRQGFERKHADMDLIKVMGGILQRNYPERLRMAALYPVNFIFRGLWAIAKYFFDERTRGKIVPLGDMEFNTIVDPKTLQTRYLGEDDYEWDAKTYYDQVMEWEKLQFNYRTDDGKVPDGYFDDDIDNNNNNDDDDGNDNGNDEGRASFGEKSNNNNDGDSLPAEAKNNNENDCPVGLGQKRCSQCNQVKEKKADFSKSQAKKNNGKCKECVAASE